MRHIDSTVRIDIRPYEDRDENAVLELLRESLGGGPAGNRSPGFFRWKHLHNVFGPSFILVAEADERLVGLRAFMQWRFAAGATMVPAVRAVDTATHPDYQRRGIFSRLTLAALEILRDRTDLVFNTPNEKSLPGYLKMGWRVAEEIRPWVRLRKVLPVVRALTFPQRWEIAKPAARIPVEAEPAVEALRDEDAMSRLLGGIDGRGTAREERLHTQRDVAYLRWRYVATPDLDYRAVRITQGGVLRGLGLFRVRPRGVLWECSIAEVLVSRGDARSAGAVLKEIVRSSPADYVTCRFPTGSTPATAARKHGFFPAPQRASFVVNPLNGGVRPDPLDGRSWALTLGDLEVF